MTVIAPGSLGREVTDEPRRPEPTASPRSSRYRWKEEYDEKSTSHNNLVASHHHPSVSSAGGSSSRTTDSIDLEKQALSAHTREREERWSQRSSPRESQDRRSKHEGPFYRVGGGSDSSPHHQTIRHYSNDDDDAAPRDSPLSSKACQFLMFFMLPAPLLSFALAIWTMIITLTLIFLHPIRLIFTRKRSFSEVVLSILAPTLNLHLRCIHSFPIAGAELQLPQTLAVLLASSFFSMGIAIWCMVLCVYWAFAAVIGNPDGLDGRSDGRELVLSTRQKWDDWLRLSVRPELRS
ncbi:hypothetical protein BDZ85DRAFT_13707 [Elsinoe ampelina]|uniref:Uncharacterized protein n=1 Tax=Elsinoe ampelina TaxID=302913 RepID=A0A6A6GSD9_9PEZI|nr:hypothetical protein BDZ85DRAFT_13707 [Elsinoe ampelina]